MGNAENNGFCVNCINKSLLFSVEPCKAALITAVRDITLLHLKMSHLASMKSR